MEHELGVVLEQCRRRWTRARRTLRSRRPARGPRGGRCEPGWPAGPRLREPRGPLGLAAPQHRWCGLAAVAGTAARASAFTGAGVARAPEPVPRAWLVRLRAAARGGCAPARARRGRARDGALRGACAAG